MSSPPSLNRFMNDAIMTASPGRLLVMLYERLVLDIDQGEQALRAGDFETASRRLVHAQEIVMELRTTLDLDVWDGAPVLAQIYGFLITELVMANVQRDPDRAASCRAIVEPLADAWRTAAGSAQPMPAAIGRVG
jgi:flagellar protein FliS